MEKKVYERIQILLKEKRISPHELAKILGINPQSVYNYLAGASKAPMSFIILLVESFPDVSTEWLLRGEGEMLKPAKKNHYLDMAERVNGTMMASEDGISPTSYRSIIESIEKMSDRIQRLEEMTRKK